VSQATERQMPLSTVLVFGLPSVALGFTWFLATVYLPKYSTDVLLMSPAAMGLVFMATRIWDAVSDPLVGHLSDRTRSKRGRRRSWLLWSSIPLGLSYLWIWSAPLTLGDAAMVAWVTCGLFLYFTATTMLAVPHESLAAELSLDHHARTRIFGFKHALQGVGSLLGVGVMALLIMRATEGRPLAMVQAAAAAVVAPLLVAWAISKVRERPDFQGRGGARIWQAFRDVLGNPHAALLLAVFLIENFGTAIISVLITYVMQYIVGTPNLTPVFILLYMVPAVVLAPFWIRMSQRVGKKQLWVFSMSAMTVAFSSMFFVGEGDVWFVITMGLLAGIGGGCGQVVAPSIQADVIDYDEYRTGERKEGMYFAVWNFVKKSAGGIAAGLSGLMLAVVGYEPNVEQTESAKLGLRILFGLVPGGCYLVGTLIFMRFGLDQAEHTRIRRVLDERAARENR
jgi:GPH family glycoside/pentoside/hexuronide:cation symporter